MIKFVKMQGTGNNYIYIDLFNNDIKNVDLNELAIKISDVNFGIGSDGLILIAPSSKADAKMIMYNKDGSEGMMCGNGIRCVARYLYENIDKKNKLLIETKSGIKKVYIKKYCDSFMVKVDMGKPVLKASKIPVLLNENKIINEKYNFNGTILNINCVSMGNPHTVIFVKDVDNVNVLKLGKLVQENKIFPTKCNVEFVEIISETHIKMRVLEIGSGETMSCGTGACASVVAGVLNGYLKRSREIKVDVLGGELFINYKNNVYLKGNADVICEGYYYN